MSDETFEYITTDYMISIESNEQTIQPVEYIVELGQEGTPGKQGDKGDPGFSPTVGYNLSDGHLTFTIVNEDGVTVTPDIFDYVMRKDGSNATLPISIGNFEILSSGNTRVTNEDITGYLNVKEIRPRNSSGITIGYANYDAPINFVTDNKVYYNGAELATVADIPVVSDKLDKNGSNADSNFTVNGVELAGNYVYISGVSSGGIHAIQTNSNIYYNLGIDSSRAYLTMPSFTLNSYPAVSTGGLFAPPLALLNSTGDIRISTSNNYKLYYGANQTASNEVAIKGDIPTVSDATITFTQGGVTKGSFTLNGSATTIDLDNGVTNPLVIPSDSGNQSLTLGFEPNSSILTFKETLTIQPLPDMPPITVDVPLPIIGSSPSSPVTLTKNETTGISTLGLAYDSTTLGLNADNELTVINGGTSYTAGTGITIDSNDVIAVDFTDVATATQGGKADTAVQPGDLATVATTGDYADLLNKPTIPTVPTNISAFTNDSGYITSSALTGYATESWVSSQGYLTNSDISDMATRTWVGQQGYITGITSSDITTALGYTPYNATNPDGFISSIDSTMVVTALGYTPYNASNPNGYISGIDSTDVVTALGYTPYNSSNPNGYTSNVGTVTSVNNTQPDTDGNVSINIPDVSDFVTNSSLATTLTDYVTNSALTTTLADYALSSDIPTNNNQLTNGAGYITSSALDGYATEGFVTSQGYITGITSSDVTTALGYTPLQSSDLSGYVTSTELSTTLLDYVQSSSLSTVATSGSYNDLTNKPTIPTNADYVDLTTAQTISSVKTFARNILQSSGYHLYSDGIYEPSGANYNIISHSGSGLYVGSSGRSLELQGSSTRPNYNTNALALLSDVPDVTTYIDTSVSSSSTDNRVPSSKLFYDTIGDIETLINAL